MNNKEHVIVFLDFTNSENVVEADWRIHTVYFLESNEKTRIYVLKDLETANVQDNIRFNSNKIICFIDKKLQEEDRDGIIYFITQEKNNIDELSTYINYLMSNREEEIILDKQSNQKHRVEKIETYCVINNSIESKALLAPLADLVQVPAYKEKYEKLEKYLQSNGIAVLTRLVSSQKR